MIYLSYQNLPELLAPLPGAPPRRRGRLTVVVSVVVLVLLVYLLLLATGLLASPGA